MTTNEGTATPAGDPCPSCVDGWIHDRMHGRTLACFDCDGTAQVAAGFAARKVAGATLKAEREVCGETLSAFCRRTGTDPVTRSRLERGIA